MSTYKSKYNYDERDRTNIHKYSDHKINHLHEDCDLTQKIKNIEIEGLKLRSQVENILHETNEDSTTRTCESMNDCDSINSDKNVICDPHFAKEDYTRINQKSFESRSSKDHNAKDNAKGLQKELEECRLKLDYMHQKLKQDSYTFQMEKEEMIAFIDNLKRSNFDLKSTNECQLQEQKSRERNLESVIECLRSNLNQLLNVNKKQEDVLAESNKRLIELESVPTTLKAFDNLRDLLIDMEYHRGTKFIDDPDLETGSPDNLVDVVEKCFKEFNLDLDDRNRKIRQMEDDMVKLKRNLMHDKEKSMLDLKNQLAFLEEQNSYLKHHVNEVTDNADRDVNKFREENMMLKSKLDNEMAGATAVIDGLENNLQQISNKLKRDTETWNLEKKSLEQLFDENEKQTATIRVERDQALNQKSSLLAKLDASQNKLSETETQLLQLQSERYSQEKQLETLNKRNKSIENSLSYTRVYLENITKSIRLSSYKGDAIESSVNETNSNNMLIDLDISDDEEIPWKPRKYEIEEILGQIKIMNKAKSEALEKFDQMKKEFEILEKEFDNNKLEKKRLEQLMKAQQLEIDSSKNENSHINSLMANRNGEIERLTAERDYYFQTLNEKTEDLSNLKAEKHRLNVMLKTKIDFINVSFTELEERCRQLELQNKSSSHTIQNNESHIIETSRGKNQILREERNRLSIQLNEMQNARDELLSTHKDQAICIEHIRSENIHLQSELKNLYRDYDQLLMENKQLLIKLKDSELEITSLCQNLSGTKTKKHLSLEKRVADLTAELSSYKNELKISQDRIKKMEKTGSKSSPIQLPAVLNELTKNMPDVDQLKLTKKRLNELEKQMNNMKTGRENIKEENVKLTDLLRKVTLQNDRMSEEIENYVEENKNLRNKVHKKLSEDDRKIKSNEYQSKTKFSPKLSNKRTDSQLTNGRQCHIDDSIHQLKEDLQESIREAKKLLMSKPLQISNENNFQKFKSLSESIGSTDSNERNTNINMKNSPIGFNNDRHINSNNNCNNDSDNVVSSALNTKRSESASLTEVDRHLHIPRIKQHDAHVQMEKRCYSPVEMLLSSDFKNDHSNCYEKRSNLKSYDAEERFKHVTIENIY